MAQATPGSTGRQPITPATRRRLQQCFEQGGKVSGAGQYDYATDMFTTCVQGDPANKIYTQSFLDNLYRKYSNNKKGSKLALLKGAGLKTSLTKSGVQKDWLGVIKNGLELLKLNPWDVGTLTSMAAACEALEMDDAQLVYLKGALEANLADPETNRLAGRALGRMGRFDEAIICWRRVEKAKPGDEEALRAIGDLTVEKTIKHGGYETAESSTEVKAGAADDETPGLTPERQLERAIAKDPSDVNNYLQLAELHRRAERSEEYEQMLTKALEVSGGDMQIRERLEDLQIARLREQMNSARRRAESERTPEAVQLYNRFKAELNHAELEMYRSRVDRYPTNLGLKYELAARLERAGKFNEAIQMYQKAQSDPQRKGLVLLGLGRSFQHIKQYKLALANYQAAVGETSDRDEDNKKLALYLAGKLALGLKELEIAEKHLSTLAGLDFGYRDVPELLDKISKLRDSGQSS